MEWAFKRLVVVLAVVVVCFDIGCVFDKTSLLLFGREVDAVDVVDLLANLDVDLNVDVDVDATTL